MIISNRQFNQLILTIMTIGFVAVMGAGGTAVWAVNRNRAFADWVDHSYLVERELSKLRLLVERAEAARRGYLIYPDASFAAVYRQTAAKLGPSVDVIAELTRDNEVEQQRIAHLRPLLDHQLRAWGRSFEMTRSAGQDVVAKFRNDGSAETTQKIRQLTSDMLGSESRLLAVRSRDQRSGANLLSGVQWVAGILLLLVGAGSLWIIRRYTSALSQSQGSLHALNADLEGAVVERTADLSRANDEIQRFAYMVSHDLRSPLINVMGYTSELTAIGPALTGLLEGAEAKAPDVVTEEARLAIREDLPEAIGFIRSSTEKMDRLINAILRLSREGRRTITPQPVDMESLLYGIRDSMQHVLNEQNVNIRIETSIPSIISDRLALEQIFSNLMENAVKYLKDDRPGIVIIRGQKDGSYIRYEVVDNGRGIDPRDQERIFDLFRRAGVQNRPGEGIGLAHVRAIAYRLGGIIDCDSALDRGAIFRLSLPATFTANNEGIA